MGPQPELHQSPELGKRDGLVNNAFADLDTRHFKFHPLTNLSLWQEIQPFDEHACEMEVYQAFSK